MKSRFPFGHLFLTTLALMLWSNGHAAALFETVSGDVRFVQGAASPVAATQGRRIEPGASVTTGYNGRTVLRFDDGQVVALSPNSEFKIVAYKFDLARPQDDSSVFDFVKGALRSVTGLLGSRSRSAFSLRTSVATVGIRGTDFMVAAQIANPTYVSVTQGAVAASNVAGMTVMSAGTTGMVASATTLATTIGASALPAVVSATFSQLGALPLAGAGAGGAAGAGASGAAGTPGAAAGAAGAQGATAAAAGGIGAGAAVGIAAAVAVVAATSNATSGTTGTK